MKIVILCMLAVLLHSHSVHAIFTESFRFFFLQFLTTTTTTTTTKPSSSSNSGASNYYNITNITYNQNISILDSNNTANVGIVGRRLQSDVEFENNRLQVAGVVESEFTILKDCFNEHATRYLETVYSAEQEVSNCLLSRLLEVIDVPKTVLAVLDEISGNEEVPRERDYVVPDAQSTMTLIMTGIHDCSNEMSKVLKLHTFDESISFEECTASASQEHE